MEALISWYASACVLVTGSPAELAFKLRQVLTICAQVELGPGAQIKAMTKRIDNAVWKTFKNVAS